MNEPLVEGIDVSENGESPADGTTGVDWAHLARVGRRPRLILETDRGHVVIEMDSEGAPQTVQTVTLAAAFGVAGDADFWLDVAAAGFVANVGFCAGACAEGYLTMIRLDRRIARGLVFAAGLSLASLGALAAVVAAAIPSF